MSKLLKKEYTKMWKNLSNKKLILASNSPRRKELLGGLGLPFEVRLKDGIDESYPDDLTGEDIPLHIAFKKAQAYLPELAEDELLITADTIVWLDGRVLGKPKDAGDARLMLQALAGRTHQVITGVCMATREKRLAFASVTDVTFASLTPEDIAYYVDHYRPFDKAGAYGIQEWIGFVGVERIEGSYYNVMGLPVKRVYEMLQQF
jgi:septum formation protein